MIGTLKKILEQVAPTYYGKFEGAMVDDKEYPLIVFSRISSDFSYLADDEKTIRRVNFQVLLISLSVEMMDAYSSKLEETLINNNLTYSMVNEYINDNNTISCVYEIKMEEFLNGK